MRRTLLAAILAAILLGPAAAHGAPTCTDRNGMGIKCGEPTAMPVGWKPPPDVQARHDAMGLGDIDANDLFSLICIVGGFFALIALMPDFGRAGGEGWDEQQDDEEQEQ